MTNKPISKHHHATTPAPKPTPLFSEIRSLIDYARQRAAVAVNAELTLLCWQVGQRIRNEVLGGERAEYGQQVIANLAGQLTEFYGKGWSQKQLHHCLRFAETFGDEQIVSALRLGAQTLESVKCGPVVFFDKARVSPAFYTSARR